MTGDRSVPNGQAALDESFDAATLPLLREGVAAYAAAAGASADRIADITLAVHELAANTVRHGPGSGRISVRVKGDVLRCQVSDPGPVPDDWPVRHGHGLWIVREVADNMEISSGPGGCTVTAEFITTARPADAEA